MQTFGKDDSGLVLTEPHEIDAYAKLARLGMLRLEVAGMFGKGGRAYRWVKRRYGLTGNKRNVLTRYTAILKKEGVLR